MLKKIFVLCLIFMLVSNIYATNEWWSKADEFFDGVTVKKDPKILSDLVDLIKVAGNAIFIIVAIVLGIKYMLGSAEGKSDVKSGLISLTVAMVFFYGWSTLETILTDGHQLIFIKDTDKDTVATIYNTIVYFLNFVAIGVVLYVGVKYLMSGAEGKAELKGKGMPFIIGLVMTFASITFLNFLGKIIADVLS